MDSRIVDFLAEYRPESRPQWYGPADKQSVLEYFVRELGPYLLATDDGLRMLHDYADAMHGMPLRSECGRDCRRLIDAWECVLSLRYGRHMREYGNCAAVGFFDELAECAGDCCTFICG